VPGCLWAILGSKIGGCEAAYRIGGGATFNCVRFGQCIRVVSVLELNGVQVLVKNLPRKQKKRWGRHGCVGQTEVARPSCEDAEFVCFEKNDDDVYFLLFVRKNLKNLQGRRVARQSRAEQPEQIFTGIGLMTTMLLSGSR
jgi:hypothetical protein